MKAVTHNVLMCNNKKCSGTDKNYPFIIKASNIINKNVEFEIEKVQKKFNRQDKRALNQFCKGLNLYKYDLTNVDDNLNNNFEFWNYIHHILNETLVNEGILICPNCGKEYPIKNGIINLNLSDDEL